MQNWHDHKYDEEPGIQFFTDGSKTEQGTGFGIYGEINVSKKLWDYATVFQAEALAINYCAKEIVQKDMQNEEIHIFSDSQSVLKALQSNKINSKTIYECVQNLSLAGTKNKIILSWIPGHEGFVGNEQADELAKKGAASTLSDAIATTISIKTVKSSIKEWLHLKCNQNFQNDLGARHSKLTVGRLSEKRTRKLLDLDRSELKNVIALYTGHGRFSKHLHMMRITTDPKCKYCEKEESAEHIMCECEAYTRLRQEYTGKPTCKVEDFANLDEEKFIRFCKRITKRMWTPLNG